MKRLTFLLTAFVGVLLCMNACDYDTEVMVEAELWCAYPNGDEFMSAKPVTYGPYHHQPLRESEVVDIVYDITTNISRDFTTASLRLHYLDNIAGTDAGDEEWGIVFDSYRQQFAATRLLY